jgi:hypothetical protein
MAISFHVDMHLSHSARNGLVLVFAAVLALHTARNGHIFVLAAVLALLH